MRRSKRKSRQTLNSSEDEGTDGQPATKRHLDLQATGKVCISCLYSSNMSGITVQQGNLAAALQKERQCQALIGRSYLLPAFTADAAMHALAL